MRGFPNAALNPNQTFYVLLPRKDGKSVKEPPAPQLKLGEDHCEMSTLTAGSVVPTPTLAAKAEKTILLYMRTQMLSKFGNKPMGYFNHSSWKAQREPLLSVNRTSWNADQLIPFIPFEGDEPTSVDLVINNQDDGAHPVHLHGNRFFLLASHRAQGRDGWGAYNPYQSRPPLAVNLKTPLLKDTVSVPRRGHVVVRVLASNPGLWMLHCHMLVHAGTGMVAGLHVGGADDYTHVVGIEPAAKGLCEAAGP